MWQTLAQQWSELTPEHQHELFVYGGILMGVVLVGFGAIAILKSRVKKQADEPPPAGFSLADLRQMHERGDLTEEEFQAAKAKLIARTRGEPPRSEGTSGSAAQ